MAQTVVGFFDSAVEAQDAVNQLVSEGFSRDNIDLSTQSPSTTTDSSRKYRDDDDDNKGGISGFFKSLFGDDDDDRDKYATVGSRSSIVTIHAMDSDEAERAADILDDAGAVDVDERAEQFRSGTHLGTMPTTPATGYTTPVTGSVDETNVSVPIIEENLEVGKRTVETGGVRLRSKIIERPVEESVRLRQERVWVERTPVDRQATDADFTAFKEGEIEVTEHAEVPVVEKQARVVEEVTLNKDVVEQDETIRETLRRTDVEVEKTTGNDRTYRNDVDSEGRTTTGL